MVSVTYSEIAIRLILQPNQSLSWRGNQYLLLCLTVWLLGFAILFATAGMWMVLPFIGLELLALAGALYYVSWKLSHRELIEISPQQVIIMRGRQRPQHHLEFPRQELIVHVTLPDHPWDSPVIELTARHRPSVRLGEFLNRDDCQRLLRVLAKAPLPIRKGLAIQMAF